MGRQFDGLTEPIRYHYGPVHSDMASFCKLLKVGGIRLRRIHLGDEILLFMCIGSYAYSHSALYTRGINPIP